MDPVNVARKLWKGAMRSSLFADSWRFRLKTTRMN